MPIIDSSQDYAAIKTAHVITASAVQHYALKIAMTNTTHNRLFSMAGGVVHFVPADAPSDPFLIYDLYPDLPRLSAGTGFLVQGLWPVDFKKLRTVLPAGVPPPLRVVYFNVAPATVRSALKPFVQARPDKSLTDNPLSGDHQQHVEEYLDKILLGKAGVFVEGGSHIGNIATNELTFFFAGVNDLTGLSPILHIRDMPDYGGEQWSNHPLIDAVSALSVPVDIYAEFNFWNDSDKAFKPVPSGVAVSLMSDHVIADENLQTITTNDDSNGKVHFTFPDLQTIDVTEPDLFFEVALGNHNPDPILLGDPWSSSVWVFSSLFGFHYTGSGYFADFQGTRLGNETLPLLFRIGLGFWAALISFRPSVSIQQQLAAGPSPKKVQFIEDAGDPNFPDDPHHTPDINLDYYPVRITIFPIIGGKLFTAMDLLRHIRININTLIDDSLFAFDLKSVPPEWTSADPAVLQELQQLLGVLVNIDFYLASINADDGFVVVSSIDTTQFTFSTVSGGILQGLKHPVNGNREIGFTAQQDGSYLFYTRGADRPATDTDNMFSSIEFRGADLSWKSLQQGIADLVNQNGGSASVQPSVSVRFPWRHVRDKYWKPTTDRI